MHDCFTNLPSYTRCSFVCLSVVRPSSSTIPKGSRTIRTQDNSDPWYFSDPSLRQLGPNFESFRQVFIKTKQTKFCRRSNQKETKRLGATQEQTRTKTLLLGKTRNTPVKRFDLTLQAYSYTRKKNYKKSYNSNAHQRPFRYDRNQTYPKSKALVPMSYM